MRGAGWWMRQAYLGLIPAFPAGYLVINGFRGDQFWAKPYVNRSAMPPSESLEELVEAELDKIGDIKKAKVCLYYYYYTTITTTTIFFILYLCKRCS
ncbi:unnamed protein product [Cylicostephanus goldi]|uniref:Uncharacterized protein n=1 Tax=Cylicostephanus goldi TaxID=71465 RepID=A0A3P7QZL0_CYLGO|nr:unnamed protein product [Cylicostephanus goldi]